MSEEEKKEPGAQGEASEVDAADAKMGAQGKASEAEADTAGTGVTSEPAADPEREAKLKAAAEARAARAAAKAQAEANAPPEAAVDPEREAKLKAAAEARAARAAAKAQAEGGTSAGGGEGDSQAEVPKPPSIRLPELELLQAVVRREVADDALDEAYLNELNDDMPTLVIKSGLWPATALLLKKHDELRFDYLRNVTGVDYETHLEVVYHLLSLTTKRVVAVKIRTDRDGASVPSATPVWRSAEWNEREIYDLLGIDFPGHPDMRRIMMPDEWVGHPLRKDYEPLDSEV